MNESLPSVVCVILNWNGWRDTNACLDALSRCSYPRLRVLVVDNGSTDDSVRQIREAHPSIARIENGKNLGFAGGNNIGLRRALQEGADYIWLLNNDTEPQTDALSQLVAKAQTDPRIGAVASVCLYANQPDQVQVWGGAKVNLWIGVVWNSEVPRSDEWFDSLYGASLLVNARALTDAGLLDEGFFLYWEETEFSLRLRKHGWKLAAAPDSRVLHKVNASTGGDRKVLDRYFTTSGLRLLRFHSPFPPLSMFLFIAMRMARRIARMQFSQIESVRAGIRDYLAQLPLTQTIR